MSSTKALLTAHDVRPKKSLGQNFLCDPQAAEAIVRHGRIGPADTVVEIGAGTGALTVHAARAASRVYAVETDSRLMDVLTETIREKDIGNVTIVNRNFMDVDLAEFFEKAGSKLVVMGNLPYYISSQILVRLIEKRRLIDRAVLMFQQELADRIAAPPGSRDYGRLSAMLRYCAEVRPLMRVRKELFYPRPAIASAVVGILFKPSSETVSCDDELLFEIIKTAFAKRRKTIKNALASGKSGAPPALWDQILEQAGIDPESRAEALDAPAYVDICRWYKALTQL
ncbi:MAG: 16S rRNA (adenine(1518)-N(6)/adenine(1519)-N(6))-dimethyltransferase RsmA [Thermodesulfobacteriota bacterium]